MFGTAAATADKTGRVVRVSGVTVDITERKRAEERQNLLTREVDHRAKNALALAQSIVRLTRGESAKSYMQAVEGRIGALARVHTILSLSSWQGAEITKLVDEELAPYQVNDQIVFSGSNVQLQPATAQTLAMALHELVTNSAKYGALSTLTGRLAIHWTVEADVLENPLGRAGWSTCRGTGIARLWNAKRDCQHRIPARGPGRIRLASGRPGLPAFGSLEAIRHITAARLSPSGDPDRQRADDRSPEDRPSVTDHPGARGRKISDATPLGRRARGPLILTFAKTGRGEGMQMLELDH